MSPNMVDAQTVSQGIWARLPLFLSTVATLAFVFLVQTLLKRQSFAKIPIAGEGMGGDEKRRQAYLTRASELYLDGYRKFKDSIFRIVTSNKFDVIVVPPKFLAEMRKLPDDVVSFDGAIEQTMHTKYTGLVTGVTLVPHIIKTSLTPALVRLNSLITDEVQHAFSTELPPCDDWTEVNINRKLLRIVALVSGRVFIGPELGRSEEYLDAAVNYTVELGQAREAVERMRPWLRPFLAGRLPEVRKLRDREAQAHRFLDPVVAARLALKDGEKPDDMLQWMIDGQGQGKFRKHTTEELARTQLGLSFAAIHTTTLTATNAFYDMAAYPEYISELRDEIRSVLAEHDGVYSSSALQAMKKLDSFLRETMRVHPLGFVSFSRKVNKAFTLSNGQAVPAGVIIQVPNNAAARDPDIFPEPEKFDPWRSYRQRQRAREEGHVEEAAQNQFVSLSTTNLTFGYGRHACPGRFFAANEIKMILANALLMYDIKLPEGVTGRYPNLNFGAASVPDPTKTLLFKRIA